MLIKKEVSLRYFEFWSGAISNAEKLTVDELDQLEQILEDTYCDELPTETEINDLMWFEFETICEWLGLDYDPETDEINR